MHPNGKKAHATNGLKVIRMRAGTIRQVNIDQEMRDAYLDYAMSVIVARALPDARDGLKPVHRRIMYALYDMGIRSDTPYKKSARIVGEVLGKYHPHGDAAVYEAMVRLAQEFSLRYMLIDGQGNFGSIDGDGPAAMRYTEARMAEIGEELMVDIDKDTVDFGENFDGSLTEPTVLPASIPNLLVNGSSGIAVGMSTNIPPHNLIEVCNALVYMLKNWDNLDEIHVRDLMQFIKGPDFPTGGLVYRHSDSDEEDSLVAAYATGRGKITVRARVHIEEMGRGKSRIIVSELPYQTNKASLIERIAALVNEGKVEGLADLRDESDRQGLRLVIELQRGADPIPVLSKLFHLTPLQDTFSIIMLALVDGEPRVLSLKQALRVFLEHRMEVVRRRSEFELARAKARAHILEGLLKALERIDEAIAIIRKSRTVETARDNLCKALKLTETQAQAILDMQLRRLAALERKKIEDEYKEKLDLIKYLEGLLKSPEQMRDVIAEELDVLKQAYGDPRRTVVVEETATTKLTAEAIRVPEEHTWVTLTTHGLMGRGLEESAPKVTADVKDPPRFIVASGTSHTLYIITARGECATIPTQQLPQVSEPPDGTPFSSLSSLKAEDEVVAVVSVPPSLEEGYFFLATEKAEVKRLRIADLPGLTAKVFTVMKVELDDRLGWAFFTGGDNEVLLTTAQAQAIRFPESEVRPTGLPAGGMRGIKLMDEQDRVVGASIVADDLSVWSITDDGIAKVSPAEEYPLQGRAGSGVIAMRLPKNSQEVAAAAIGNLDETIIVLTNKGKPLSMRLGRAPQIKRGRNGGDSLISLRPGERVVAVVHYQPRITLPTGMSTEESPSENGATEPEG